MARLGIIGSHSDCLLNLSILSLTIWKMPKKLLPKKVVFLHDSTFEFDGISFGNISMRSLQSKEQNVQSATKMDFLITHIPPEGILDEGRGSRPLLLEVYRSQPRFHVFGHAHSCGNQSKGGAFTEFYNVSQFNELKNQDGGQ